jgi:hypothetical protein
MSIKKIFIGAIILGMLNIFIMGCGEEGPAEKAGKKFDKTMDAVKDTIKEKTSD